MALENRCIWSNVYIYNTYIYENKYMLIYSYKFYSDNSDDSDTCVSWVRTQDAYLVLCAFWWPLSVCHHGSLPQRPLRVCWSLRIPPSQCCKTGNVLENVFRSKYTWLHIYIHAHTHIYIDTCISRYTWPYMYIYTRYYIYTPTCWLSKAPKREKQPALFGTQFTCQVWVHQSWWVLRCRPWEDVGGIGGILNI